MGEGQPLLHPFPCIADVDTGVSPDAGPETVLINGSRAAKASWFNSNRRQWRDVMCRFPIAFAKLSHILQQLPRKEVYYETAHQHDPQLIYHTRPRTTSHEGRNRKITTFG